MLILLMLVSLFIRNYDFRKSAKKVEPQRDTVYVYDTIHYSGLQLTSNTYKLDIPKVGAARLVYIPEHSLDTIYQDNVKYVTMPREYFYTKTKDVEIWHSGVQSTIDSLNVFRKSAQITESQTIGRKAKGHSIGVGIEANYMGEHASIPVYLEYERMIRPWISVYASVGYDLLSQQYGAGLGGKINLSW